MTEAMNDPRLLSARAAAARLGVKLETLYAYVSRGLIEPRRRAGRRESLFAAEDVERLRAGGRRRVEHELAVESALTLIRPDGHFYRGLPALELATAWSFEQTAEWLWSGARVDEPVWEPVAGAVDSSVAAQATLPAPALPLERLAVAAAAAALADDFRFETTPQSAEAAA